MKDDKMRQEIQSAMDTCLSGIQPDALLVQRVLKGEKKTGKKKPVQITAFAAAFVLVAAAVVLIMGKVLPVWPDARNAAQETDLPAIAAQETPTDLVGQRFEVGHITFTVLEQYADPYAAMITLRAGMSEGEAGILCRYESTSTISAETADRLGVSQGITWAQAAKELDLPLYGVWALLYDPANSSNTPGLTRNEENSDGSVTIHASAFLTGDAGNLAESVKLRLMALKTDTENPSNQAERETKDITVPLHFETISETQRYTIPEGQTGSSRFRYDDWDEKSQRTVTHEVRLTFTPVAAQADLTPAGVYVKVECRVAEENIERGLNFGLGMASTRILGADGDVLPGDQTYSFPMAFPMDDSAWPMVTFTRMIDADSIPEEMTFELLNRNETVLHLELKRE